MLIWSDQYVFNFPWETVVQAAFRKYPTRHNPNVKCLDTIERSNVTGYELISHRLFGTAWNLPSIISSFKNIVDASYMYVHEHSVCNSERKTLQIGAENISLCNLFTMKEELCYTVHPDDPNKTVLEQKTIMNVHGIPLLGDILESMLINSYQSVIAKGRMAVEEKSELINMHR